MGKDQNTSQSSCLRGAVEFKEARWTWDQTHGGREVTPSAILYHQYTDSMAQMNSRLHTTHTYFPYTERKKETIQPYAKRKMKRSSYGRTRWNQVLLPLGRSKVPRGKGLCYGFGSWSLYLGPKVNGGGSRVGGHMS